MTGCTQRFPQDNVKRGGVHDDWSTMFNQCCKTVFFSIHVHVHCRLKGGEAPWYHHLEETLVYIIYMYKKILYHYNIIMQSLIEGNVYASVQVEAEC